MNKPPVGLWYIHISALTVAGTGVFARSIQLPAYQLIAWRALFAGIVLFLFIKIFKKTQKMSLSQWTWLLCFGAATCFHWVTYFHAMQIAGVAVGMLSLFTFPVMTVLFEPIINKTAFHKKDLIAALIVFCGIALMIPEFDLSNQVTQGVFWGVLSAFVWSLRNIYFKKKLSDLPSDQSMMWQLVIVAIMLLPFSAQDVFEISRQDWYLLIALALFCTALPHTLLLASMKTLSAKTSSLISCLQPVYGTLFAFFILSEAPNWQTMVGGVFIIGASIFESLSVIRKTN
ncbi:DMT family transporter [Marinicellulosiphila megalodicopiae]|uniref:DMT family transporter n=1 Tax=Marinicellulosiphila megalodicopiae TaxID=2724896 RepID=UPI003BB17197